MDKGKGAINMGENLKIIIEIEGQKHYFITNGFNFPNPDGKWNAVNNLYACTIPAGEVLIAKALVGSLPTGRFRFAIIPNYHKDPFEYAGPLTEAAFISLEFRPTVSGVYVVHLLFQADETQVGW